MTTYQQLSDYNKRILKTERFQVYVKGEGKIQDVICEGAVSVDMEREGAPSKLTMRVVEEEAVKVKNGYTVMFLVDGKPFWHGYVFTVRAKKEPIVEVTCYDQLRYLKNKDTYQYEDTTYDQLLKRICTDQGLIMGTIEPTEYPIAGRLEEDKEYWDMLEVAHQYTVAYSGEVFVLFDKAGKIHLQNLRNLRTKDPMWMVDADGAQDYEYSASIDENTYNRIKIDQIDEEANVVTPVIVEDKEAIGRWGLLQYYAQTTEKDYVPQKAAVLLRELNRETRKLKVPGVVGNTEVRAGSLVPVLLRFRDIAVNGWMVAERVRHHFEANYHTMELELLNKDFRPKVDPSNAFQDNRGQNSGGESDSGSGGGMEGSTVQEQIWSFFHSKGYSKEAIAGIMGNLAQESGYNPSVTNSIGAFGLAQWLGSRRADLEAFAASRGTRPTDVQTQLEFLHSELMDMNGGKSYTQMTDVQAAAVWFRKKFERPAEWEANDPRRISEAQKAYGQFKNWQPSQAGTTTASGGKTSAFLRYVTAQEGTPYSQEQRMSGAYHDCSSLVLRGMRAAGLDTTGANLTTRTIAQDSRFVQISKAQLRQGDILWQSGHMAVYMGNGKTFEAKDYGKPTGYAGNIGRFTRYYRIKGT